MLVLTLYNKYHCENNEKIFNRSNQSKINTKNTRKILAKILKRIEHNKENTIQYIIFININKSYSSILNKML